MKLKAIINFVTLSFLFFFYGFIAFGEDNEFSIIVLPDTQNYVKYPHSEGKFMAQTKWIVENKEKLNIIFVIHEGDITDNNSPEQWQKAKDCIKILDGVVPYSLCVGNHDINHKSPDGFSLIDTYFPEEYFANLPSWGGKMPNQNCFWYKFEAGNNKFILISLDLGANDKMLEWADEIVSANKNCKAILVTHELLDENGKLSTKETKKNATAYGHHLDGSQRNTGQEVWEKHISKHSNYILALCGHYNGIASRTKLKGINGKSVHIIMANYQYSEGGGNGFLRIMTFNQNATKSKVSTYSPFLDKFWKDEKNEFEIKWEE